MVGRVDTASTATQHDRSVLMHWMQMMQIYRSAKFRKSFVFIRCKKIVERFLELDIKNTDVEEFLHQFVLPVNSGHK